tara:strand:+ start:153 stop:482 length:330 start_codon:yes stop_codon:yes gene_type:complete
MDFKKYLQNFTSLTQQSIANYVQIANNIEQHRDTTGGKSVLKHLRNYEKACNYIADKIQESWNHGFEKGRKTDESLKLLNGFKLIAESKMSDENKIVLLKYLVQNIKGA